MNIQIDSELLNAEFCIDDVSFAYMQTLKPTIDWHCAYGLSSEGFCKQQSLP